MCGKDNIIQILLIIYKYLGKMPSQVVLVVKNLPVKAGDVRHMGLIPELGRSPGRGHGNPFQYSYLGNPMDRGASWATVHGVTKESDMS